MERQFPNSILKLISEKVTSTIEASEERGFGAFEVQFAIACLLFMESKCDFMIYEAGIGGRYDPVRNIKSSVTAVTSVDLEHTNLLGNTLELIVLDKTDACAYGGIIVYGENCFPLRTLIKSYISNKGVRALFLGSDPSYEDVKYFEDHQTFGARIGPLRFEITTRILGSVQVNNSLIAATLFREWLLKQGQYSEAHFVAAVQEGARNASWPGRLERVCDAPLVIVDVAHTPDGIRQTLGTSRISISVT